MNFCKKCGNILPFGNLCPRCGAAEGDSGPAAVAAGKNVTIKNLERFRDLLGENEELKSMIRPQSEFPATNEQIYKKRSLIKFFWPFLVGGIVGGFVIYFGSIMISLASIANTDLSGKSEQQLTASLSGGVYGGYIVAILVALAVIMFGLFVCKRKQADFNSNAEYMNRMATERYEKGLQNQKMVNLYQENINEMHKYESLVPEDFQTYQGVNKIVELLKNDDAQTVEEACDILRSA